MLSGRVPAASLFTLAAASVLAAGSPVQAQQTEIEALREQMKALQQRLDDLAADQQTMIDDQKKAADTASKTPAVTSRFPVTVSGLFQVRGDAFAISAGRLPKILLVRVISRHLPHSSRRNSHHGSQNHRPRQRHRDVRRGARPVR
jgi:hypothetical protein